MQCGVPQDTGYESMCKAVPRKSHSGLRDASAGALQADPSSLPALPGAGRASAWGETRWEAEGLWVFPPVYGNISQQVKQQCKEQITHMKGLAELVRKRI